MPEESIIHNTFVIERNYPSPPQRVFNALADPSKKRRWFAEGEHHEVEEFEMDFRIGGIERARSRFKEGTPFSGVILEFEGSFQDIVPNRRVVTSSNMSFGGKRISVSLVTIEISPTEDGTELKCTFQGVFLEGADGPKIREAGWRKIFDRLAVELAQ